MVAICPFLVERLAPPGLSPTLNTTVQPFHPFLSNGQHLPSLLRSLEKKNFARPPTLARPPQHLPSRPPTHSPHPEEKRHTLMKGLTLLRFSMRFLPIPLVTFLGYRSIPATMAWG